MSMRMESAYLQSGVMRLMKKAGRGGGLTPGEAGYLLRRAGPGDLPCLYRTAGSLTRQMFGAGLSFFAPLYFSNYCINNCVYCGFRTGNTGLGRRVLSDEEFVAEARHLWNEGHRSLLLVAGEHPVFSGLGQMAGYITALRRAGLNFALMAEVAPLAAIDYVRLRDLGISRCILYQETYSRETYRSFHAGPKADYDRRHDTPERALAAGMPGIGLGVLLGLNPFAEEIEALISHARLLHRRYGPFSLSLSFPRIRPASGADFRGDFPVSDEDYLRIIAVTRLALPDCAILLSTRETPELRRRILEEAVGVTHMSAGVSTAPGGYRRPDEGGGQFEFSDRRSLAEVTEECRKMGYEPKLIVEN